MIQTKAKKLWYVVKCPDYGKTERLQPAFADKKDAIKYRKELMANRRDSENTIYFEEFMWIGEGVNPDGTLRPGYTHE